MGGEGDRNNIPHISFFLSQSYSWDAMLLHTKVKLERLSDKTKYDFFEASLRGGICQASLRHSVANNPYQGEGNWDPLQAIKYLVQYDANNL